MLRSKHAIAAALLCVAFGCSTSPTSPDPTPAPTPTPPPAPVAPSITAQPSAQTIDSGQTATLSVTASGDAPLSYQWYGGPSGNTSTPVASANSSSFTTPALSSDATYWVRVSNAAGVADSSAATITVRSVVVLPPSDPDAVFEDTVVQLVNQNRTAGAVCGSTTFPPAAPLAMNAQLRMAARAHSQDMATQGYFSHTSLDGRTFTQRIRNAGYLASPIGENIAAGYSTPQSVVAGWMASPGHCSNIMSGSFRAIGVGYAFRAGSPFGYYWTQDFGGS